MPLSALKVVLYKVCNCIVTVLSTVTVLPEHLGSKVNIPNISLLRSLEPFEKFGVGGSKPLLLISPRPRPKSRLINSKIHDCHITGEEVCRG